MGGLPDMLFVIDTNKEEIAVLEATKLGIPVVAVLDSNSDPRKIRYPFPGNDDASRAINLYCDLAVAAVLDGIQAEMSASGIDVGSIADLRRDRGAAGPRRSRDCRPPRSRRPRPPQPASRRAERPWPRSRALWSRSCASGPAPA